MVKIKVTDSNYIFGWTDGWPKHGIHQTLKMTMFYGYSVPTTGEACCSNVRHDWSAPNLCRRYGAFLSGTLFDKRPKNRCSCGLFYSHQGWHAKAIGSFFHCGRRWYRRQPGGSGGRAQSTTNAYWHFVWQKTIPHPIPIPHGRWRAIRCLPAQGSKGLFFNHFAKVGRLTLKIRQMPRMLGRSK